jgi:ribosomal-protein-alanine N-acetyltransferase
MIIASTPRLMIRRLAIEDAPFIVELLNEPSFLRFIGDRGVRTDDDARAYLAAGPLQSYADHGFGLCLVLLADSDTRIGICGLLRRAELDDAELGFALLPQFGGAGYAREAASAVLEHARVDLALTRVLAIVQPGNATSIRVLEGLGFSREQEIERGDDRASLLLYGRTL